MSTQHGFMARVHDVLHGEARARQDREDEYAAYADTARTERQQWIDEFRRRDHAGTPVADVLGAQSQSLCSDFLKDMKQHDFTYAVNLCETLSTDANTPKHLQTPRMFQRLASGALWHDKGYDIGKMYGVYSPNSFNELYLCSDGLLRVRESHLVYIDDNLQQRQPVQAYDPVPTDKWYDIEFGNREAGRFIAADSLEDCLIRIGRHVVWYESP